ncbi:MAG: MBL fold metallo-hydrolase [Defluviitaleaceae bacterium]|nr:MBL fold metallo-hydrolase [Defluviitaleaceae bacterium]
MNKRSIGRAFAITMALMLAFALVYTFIFASNDLLLPGDNEIIVAFLDVGQGDSVLIRSRDHAVLIDGGDISRDAPVLMYLRRAGVSRLDYVIATHPHRDHIGGLIAVLNRVDVGRVLMPDVVHTTEVFVNFISVIENNHIPAHAPTPEESFRAGIIEFTVLAPAVGFAGNNVNDASIVLRLDHGETSFLFTGDAEANSEQAMLASGQDLRADVIKIGHHGSRTSTTDVFLSNVLPTAAVISVGGGNRFGHPHYEVLERLANHGIQVFRTDEMGTVIMATDGKRVVLLP